MLCCYTRKLLVKNNSNSIYYYYLLFFLFRGHYYLEAFLEVLIIRDLKRLLFQTFFSILYRLCYFTRRPLRGTLNIYSSFDFWNNHKKTWKKLKKDSFFLTTLILPSNKHISILFTLQAFSTAIYLFFLYSDIFQMSLNKLLVRNMK